MTLLTILIIGALLAVLFLIFRDKREGYGQMRSIKKIPFSDCARICNQYYRKCIEDDPDRGQSGWCEARFGDACRSECYYSNYHRTR